jgi:hypothetical protein
VARRKPRHSFEGPGSVGNCSICAIDHLGCRFGRGVLLHPTCGPRQCARSTRSVTQLTSGYMHHVGHPAASRKSRVRLWFAERLVRWFSEEVPSTSCGVSNACDVAKNSATLPRRDGWACA